MLVAPVEAQAARKKDLMRCHAWDANRVDNHSQDTKQTKRPFLIHFCDSHMSKTKQINHFSPISVI
jgi:hypothetical protein